MTIVYCWLDQSLSRERITAVADSRISTKVNGAWIPLQEQTIKLFAIAVRCFSIGSLCLETGTWRRPYFETELGLALAGDLFQTQSIVNAFARVASQLVADGDLRPVPSAHGMLRLLKQVADNWLASYKQSMPDVQLLLFGYSPESGSPWAARLKFPQVSGPDGDQFEEPMSERSVFIIGADAKPSGLDYASKLRTLFMRRAGRLNLAELRRAGFEPDLELARMLNADRMLIEEDVASLLMAHTQSTIGGVMHKMEIFPCERNQGIAASSIDDVVYLNRLDDVAAGLAYRSVFSAMGTRGRPRNFE